MTDNDIALVVGGGGIKGMVTMAALAKVTKELLKQGKNISFMSGSSIGAVIATQFTECLTPNFEEKIDTEQPKKNWLREVKSPANIYEIHEAKAIFLKIIDSFTGLGRMSGNNVLSVIRLILKIAKLIARVMFVLIASPIKFLTAFVTPGILSNLPLTGILNRIDMERVVHSPIRLEVVCTNLDSGTEQIFVNHDYMDDPETFREAVIASTCYPPVFAPRKIQGIAYSDGGLVNPLPIDRAILAGYKNILVFSHHYQQEGPVSFSLGDLTKLIPADIKGAIYSADISLFYFQEAMINWAKELAKRDHTFSISVFKPSHYPATVSLLDFQPGDMEEMVKIGNNLGDMVIEEIFNSKTITN